MTSAAASVVVAAGVVCWTVHRGEVLVLLVHQVGRPDASLPKGKVDAGETLPEAAVRETREETGLAVHLGAPLGSSEYVLPGGRGKIVHYWAAEAVDGRTATAAFVGNDEISAVDWLSVADARAELRYDEDRAVLDRFAARVERDELRTFALIALRHGKAVPAGSWRGTDSTRPLEPLGLDQAKSAARAIAAFAPVKLITSTAARCMSTIEPLASLTGLDVKATAALSQDAYEDGDADVAAVVAKRLAKHVTAVLCSHGPVLPVILEQAATQSNSSRSKVRRAAALDTGAFAVVHFALANPARGIVAVETHGPVEHDRVHPSN